MKIAVTVHHQIFHLISSLFAGLMIGISIGVSLNISDKDTAANIVASIATLAAAFWGANYAFRLQNQKQKEDLDTRNREQGNKAIVDLIVVHGCFKSFYNQVLKDHIDSPFRHVLILPEVAMNLMRRPNFESLTFILDTEDMQLYLELLLFCTEVESALAAIKERTDIHLNEVQNAFHKAGFSEGGYLNQEAIREILGERIDQTMRRATDHVVEGVVDVMGKATELIKRLNMILKSRYPDQRVITAVLPN